jgi:hypothetical protein
MAGDDDGLADYRRHLYEALNSASRDYDQAILTLAAGTLALSVTFAHDITPQPAPNSYLLLLAAWGWLIVTLLAVVLSFLTSDKGIRERILGLERPGGAQPKMTRIEKATTALNWIAGIGLVIGLMLLAGYAVVNLGRV